VDFRHKYYPEVEFGGFTDIDGTVAFFGRVNSLLKPEFVVLDVGCGRGALQDEMIDYKKELVILKGKVSKVIGIDVDVRAIENPFLDEFQLLESANWPIEDSSVDLIVCDFVMEHVEDPDQFLSEARRVLKNGGYICLRTPNRWGYVGLAASLIPNRFHAKVTSAVQDGRKEEDVFPTLYRCNSIRKLRRALRQRDFHSVVYGFEAEPCYCAFSGLAFFAGVVFQRFAPKLFRSTLFAFGRLKKR